MDASTRKPPPAESAAQPRRSRRWLVVSALAAGLGALVIGSTVIGPLRGAEVIPGSTVFWIVGYHLTGGLFPSVPCPPSLGATACTIQTEIVWGARFPPLLLAVLVGVALGISGSALQGVFRNPLVDPYLLGLSTGAAAGAAVLFAFNLAPAQQATLLPVLAFAGGMVPGSVVYFAARGRSRSVETLLLTGVALNFLFAALLDVLLLYNPSSSQQVNFWLLGGLGDASWNRDAIVFGVLLVGGTLIALHGRSLNVLQLGQDVAQSVGVDAARTTRRLILLSTVLTAVAVAFSGVIGFVGLVSPHVIRRVVGSDYRLVVPLSGLFGATFLVLAWDLAQSVVPSVVIPVGIPTAFAGAPFFLYLLYRRGGLTGRGVMSA
jgi:iron complex transport system permease protein